MNQPHRVIATIFFALLAPGCMSIGTSADVWPEPNFFGGVIGDWDAIGDELHGRPTTAIGIIDMPFSFVVDLVKLPLDVVLTLREAEEVPEA